MSKFDVVQAWIDNVAFSHSKSENTETGYRYYIARFCDFIGKTPEQILSEYESMTDREFKRKYAMYVRTFISDQVRCGYAVGTVRRMVSIIKSFFRYNDLPLGHVPIARKKVTFHNRDITKDEIIKLLEISKPRDRAFFCTMAQSGLRPFTLCKLRYKYVLPDFEKGIIPCKIEVPKEIAKGEYRGHFTFMGEESIKYLKAYLATRSRIGPEDYLFTAHGLDKKASPKSITRIFARLVDKLKASGLIDFKDRKFDKPSEMRLYNLRRYFRKMAHQAGFEIVQFWMGHVIEKGQEEHYRPQEVEWHRKLYAEKAMPNLRLETATPGETEQTVMELRKQLEDRNREIGELRNGMTKLQPLMNFVNGFETEEALQTFLSRLRNSSFDITFEGQDQTLVSLRLRGEQVRTFEEFEEWWRKKGFKNRDEAMQYLMKKIIAEGKSKKHKQV